MTDHDPKCLAYEYGPGQRMDICICTGIRIGRAAERELGEAIARGMVEQAVREEAIRLSKEGWMAPESHEAVRATTRARAKFGTRRALRKIVAAELAKSDEILNAPRSTGREYLEAAGASRALNAVLTEIDGMFP